MGVPASARTVTSVLLALAGALVVVLAATGVWLWFEYRPVPDGVDRAVLPDAARRSLDVQRVHRWASVVLTWVAVGALAAAVVDAVGTRRGGHPPSWTWVPAVGGLVATLALAVTGYLLPWSQLALTTVTTGEGLDGLDPVFGDGVRFVLLGGVEVGVETYRRWAVVHAGLLPVALVACGLLMAAFIVRARRARRARGGAA